LLNKRWRSKCGSYIAEIRPIASSKKLRAFGLCAGEFTVPDDFDAFTRRYVERI